MEVIKPGVLAKDFLLKDQEEKDHSLTAYKGRKVLLSFHPLAWTSICGEQMKALEEKREELAALNTVPLGISVDSVPCKAAWAKELGISSTRLLSDFWPHGAVASAYGLFREKNGFSERAKVIIDEEGKIVFVKVYPIKELPDLDEILAFLRA